MSADGAFRILCVDDEVELVETLAAFLRAHTSALIETARSIPDAIKSMRENGPFDLIVSDYQLAPHTALDLAHHLNAKKIASKLVLFSGFDGIKPAHFEGENYLGLVAKPDHRDLLALLHLKFPHLRRS